MISVEQAMHEHYTIFFPFVSIQSNMYHFFFMATYFTMNIGHVWTIFLGLTTWKMCFRTKRVQQSMLQILDVSILPYPQLMPHDE